MRFFGTVKSRQGTPFGKVPVTDGRNIVFTDENGAFDFEGWEDAGVLSLNLLTKDHDDWYFPVEGHEGSYDFMIRPADPQEDFSIIHTSDTEIEGEDPLIWVDFLKKEIAASKAALFLHTGDIARLEGMRRHYLATNYETLGCPVRYTVGNHDLNSPRYGEEYYQRYYGPCWYSFDVGNVHFVALSINKGETKLKYSPEDQWIWFEKDAQLNRDKVSVVITHGEYRGPYRFGTKTYDPVAMGVKAWIYGHLHSNFATFSKGLLHVCTNACNKGGICSCEAAAREIRFTDGKLTSRLLTAHKEDPQPQGYQRRLSLGERTLYTQPIKKEGCIYLATNDDGWEKSCHVYKIDAKTNTVIWRFPTVNGVKNHLAVENGRVFCQDSQGIVCAIDDEQGRLLWQKDLAIPKIPYTKKGVLLVEGMLICGESRFVCALDPTNGQELWRTVIPTAEPSPAQWVYDKTNRQLIVSAHWKCLYSLDVRTGEILWQNFAGELWFRSATPAILDGLLFTTGGHYLCKVGLTTGSLTQCLWSEHVFDSAAPPKDGGDAIYLSSSTGGVFAIDKRRLTVKRRYEASPAAVHTAPYKFRDAQTVEGSPVLWEDKLIFAASDGFLYVYRREDASLLVRYELGSPCLTTPIVDEEGITLVTMDGELLTFPLTTE